MISYRQKRMIKQQQANDNHPTQGFTFVCLTAYYQSLRGIIIGKKGTLYQDACIQIDISVPIQYPFKPPTCKYAGQSFHPNIKQDGNICLKILSNERWSPAFHIIRILQTIQQLLLNPLQNSCNIQARKLYMQNRKAYGQVLRSKLQKYNQIKE